MAARPGIGAAVLALAACAAGALAAPDAPQLRHRGIAHDALYDVCFDARGGVAVGAAGVVLASADGGASWQPQPQAATPLALLGIACEPARRLAVGQSGAILVDDGGGWRRVESGSTQRLLAVDANDAGIAVAVGGFGTVLLSRDHGEHWEALAFDWQPIVEDFAEPHLYDVHVAPDGAITLVGEFELVLRSGDAGASWTRVHKGDASLFGLHIGADGVGYAVGQQGRILRSDDGGAGWSAVATPVDAPLLGVWSAPGQPVFVAGMRTMLVGAGDAWRSIDGADIATGWYAAIAQVPAGVVAVGNGGQVLAIAPAVRNDAEDDKHNR